MHVKPERTRLLKKGNERKGPVIYWMSRDQRAKNNWALLFAKQKAQELGQPLAVVFCFVPDFLGAAIRQYGFMLEGLKTTEEDLEKKHIPFYLLQGDPSGEIPKFIDKYRAGALVTDFDPLKIKRTWKKKVSNKISIPFYEVDAHNIVPCWVASDKQEYAAYTFRPKINSLLPEYLEQFPPLRPHNIPWKRQKSTSDWAKARKSLKIDTSVPEISWLSPGERAATYVLNRFIKKRLADYDDARNDPTEEGTSDLSPYLHFGQISAQRVALKIRDAKAPRKAKEAFLEELIVRRELSDNLCYYNKDYDKFRGLQPWAKKTLNEHRKDKRGYTYSLKRFEESKTHDPLWNAAQTQLVRTGKMHGYLRMYWGKKILEWSQSPEKAFKVAISLNDKYELDGRDPNGYAGVAWSIGGIHDRAWPERAIFGKIRYMSYNGCKSKFNVDKYIEKQQD
ncbi:MAG: deoxyribodipyrimidine photo-lyase [Candidatus Omnitrophica bacterium]|nr:deoxyribodipyrimidine photo-lyase [Candidatus Omnitrophota bacterium]